jgi:hypothetical protein
LGSVLSTSGLILVLTEDGFVVLVNPDPTGYSEVDRFRALDGSSSSMPGLPVKCWNAPAISNGRLYVRSTTEAVCLDVAAAASNLPLPPLRLSGLFASDIGAFRLYLNSSDNTPLDSNQVANIDIFAAADLTLALTNWVKLTNPIVSTNGLFFLEEALSLTTTQRFYRAAQH